VPSLRVLQNVLAGRLGGLSFLPSLRTMLLPSKREVRRVHEILERVGIPEKLYERTDRLSGGQKQRVAVARALEQDPAALLADEPVSSVDPARARDLVRLLTEISRERGLTLCMSLHNVEIAREYFPRLVGLRHGRIAFDRPAAKIGDPEIRALYTLAREELLADGT
jgi:phosphonate transport system ATP-binding protein